MEESLWEMNTVVFPFEISRRLENIWYSAMGSRVEVGSSKINIFASLQSARAKANFCPSPPDSSTPFSSSSL